MDHILQLFRIRKKLVSNEFYIIVDFNIIFSNFHPKYPGSCALKVQNPAKSNNLTKATISVVYESYSCEPYCFTTSLFTMEPCTDQLNLFDNKFSEIPLKSSEFLAYSEKWNENVRFPDYLTFICSN